MITVTVNGQPRTFADEMPLPDLIRLLEISFPRIAVAHNGTVLRQDEHAQTIVRDGDALEIVRMVGGGANECEVRSAECDVGGDVENRGS